MSLISGKLNLFYLVFFLLLMNGCHSMGFIALSGISYNNDITDNETLWGGFKKEQIFKLNHEMFLSEKETWQRHYVIVPPQEKNKKKRKLYNSPKSISAYYADKNSWPDVIDILPEGTSFQCSKLFQIGRYGGDNVVEPYAKIINGPHKGKEVEISELALFSESNTEETLFYISPDLNLINEAK